MVGGSETTTFVPSSPDGPAFLETWTTVAKELVCMQHVIRLTYVFESRRRHPMIYTYVFVTKKKMHDHCEVGLEFVLLAKPPLLVGVTTHLKETTGLHPIPI